MNITAALGKIGVPKEAELMGLAPGIEGREDLVAACIVSENYPNDGSNKAGSAEAVAVTEAGALLVMTRYEDKYEITQIPGAQISSVVVKGRRLTLKGQWEDLSLSVRAGGVSRTFHAPEAGLNYDTDEMGANALLGIAKALLERVEGTQIPVRPQSVTL